MIPLARFDPVPAVGPLLALPEPAVGLQVIHREIDRLDRLAPMAGGSGYQHDGFPHPHHPAAVHDQQAPQVKPFDGPVCQLFHAGKGHLLVMDQLQRLDFVIAANFTHEGAHAAKAGMRNGERPNE